MHTLANIRITLLAQHELLRRHITKVQQVAELWGKKERSREELQQCIHDLANELTSHNKCEEKLLGDIIPTIDAWGPLRAEAMLDAHIAEHQELARQLFVTSRETDTRIGAKRISTMLGALTEHMDHEERTFLSESVLNDSLAPSDTFGG
jgi:hypothetical protein